MDVCSVCCHLAFNFFVCLFICFSYKLLICLFLFLFCVRLRFLLPSILFFSVHPPLVFAYFLIFTGFLQITPEGSPQAQRRGELGGEADVSGSFCLQTSALGFNTQETTEEHQVSSSKDRSVTLVTKTTRTTKHTVTTETQQGESSTTETKTHQLYDVNY